jgi:hypothetical protein
MRKVLGAFELYGSTSVYVTGGKPGLAWHMLLLERWSAGLTGRQALLRKRHALGYGALVLNAKSQGFI